MLGMKCANKYIDLKDYRNRAASSHFDALGEIPVSPPPIQLPHKIIKITYKIT